MNHNVNSDSQFPETVNHVTLEDKRTDYISDDVHLESPIDSPRRDGIFRP